MYDTENLLREVSKQVNELRVLYRSALRLTDKIGVQELLQAVTEDILSNTCLERVAILFYQPSEEQFELQLAQGFNGDRIPKKIPAHNINSLLKKSIWRGEPANIIISRNGKGEAGDGFQLFKDGFGNRQPCRQPINLFVQGDAALLSQDVWPHETELHDSGEPSPFPGIVPGMEGPFIVVPFHGQGEFIGLLIADRGKNSEPIPYSDTRLTAAIVRHASRPIIIALRQQEMLARIEEQNHSLERTKKRLSSTLEHTRHLKSFYESIIQNLKSGLITVSQQMNITHINRAAEEMLGYSKDELVGKSIRILLPEPIKGRRCIFREQVEALDIHKGYTSEIELVCKNGEHIPVETCFSVIIDSHQEIRGLSCIFRDISEKRIQEQHLARIERLASLGELAAGVAHEIKNPLAGINGALQILAQSYPSDSSEREIFQEILKQIKRLDQVVHQLLEFARPKKPDVRPINLIEIINHCLFLVTNKITQKRIKTKISLDSDHPMVNGDPDMLQQAILNIILNALDAMDRGGTLEIHTCWTEKAKHCAQIKCISSRNRSFRSGVRILIRDTGPGISPEEINSIFNPFFTTKSRGTGLGLAITHRIIEQHDGTIFVDSKPGHGTTFIINLPISPLYFDENR